MGEGQGEGDIISPFVLSLSKDDPQICRPPLFLNLDLDLSLDLLFRPLAMPWGGE